MVIAARLYCIAAQFGTGGCVVTEMGAPLKKERGTRTKTRAPQGGIRLVRAVRKAHARATERENEEGFNGFGSEIRDLVLSHSTCRCRRAVFEACNNRKDAQQGYVMCACCTWGSRRRGPRRWPVRSSCDSTTGKEMKMIVICI